MDNAEDQLNNSAAYRFVRGIGVLGSTMSLYLGVVGLQELGSGLTRHSKPAEILGGVVATVSTAGLLGFLKMAWHPNSISRAKPE